jgi:L-lactate dehydrogenase complex protein LldG
MDSREEILRALRRVKPADVPLPEVGRGATRYPDPVKQYLEALAVVGGSGVRVLDAAQLRGEVRALAERLGARRVVSRVPEASEGNSRLEELSDPHQMEGIDLAIVRGAFAVAENGAVWVSTAGLGRNRGVFVVTQHLALVVHTLDIVHDMHEAYERVSFEGAGFGLFIAGPSKTADIEQSLVIGAHGARSCTVFLVG